MKHHIIPIALAAMLLAFASCGDGSAVTDGGAQTSGVTETTAPTEIPVSEILGFEKEDNGGRTFTIYADSIKSYDFDAEKTNGDVVNDAVYEKNQTVEEYLGIDFEFIFRVAGWNERAEFNQGFTNDILAGDSTIDLISAPVVITTPIVSEGYFLEGQNLEVDFSHPWWLDNMYERFSIANKLYGFLGDYSLSLYKDMSVIFFNKRIWSAVDAPDPYALVRNNEWTLDTFIEIVSGMGQDLNGDGKFKLGEDQMTYVSEVVPGGTFQTTLELKVIELDENGMPQYLGLTDRFLTAYEKMATLFERKDVAVHSSIDDKSYTTMKTFANGTVATMANFLYSTEYLRDMEDDYGIVPYPKYDENQESYLAQLGTSTEMLFVPVTNKDVALTSKVMEALGYYMKELAVPKYYEVALKEKYARDNDMHEMLDMIRAGASFDFVFVYGTSLDYAPNDRFRFYSIEKDLASGFAKNEKAFTKSLDAFVEKIAALET